jgi:2-phospho-L-lactate guanylyltransferase (CobY/MobA/RfbA family)
VLLDIDTPQDLAAARAHADQASSSAEPAP